MLGTLNAPSVLHIAPAMTRPPQSVTVIKASTGPSKTPPPWLVQVSRIITNFNCVSRGILNFCLFVSLNFDNMVELSVNISAVKRYICYNIPYYGHEKFSHRVVSMELTSTIAC